MVCNISLLQSNTIPERGTIYDFCFEKKASGQWIDWMDTVDKHLQTLAADAKVSTLFYFKNYTVKPVLSDHPFR